jgi:hypothetical protein
LTTPKQALFPCPECGAKYKDKRGLATHRRYQHGFISQDRSAIAQREAKAKRRAQSKNAVALALTGINKPQFGSMAHTKNAGIFPCSHCEFVAKWKGGLTHHMNAKHPVKEANIASTEARNEASIEASNNGNNRQTRRSAIPEAAIAFTAGRIEELLLRTATELDLPPKSLAAGVIELIHAKTLR